MSYERKTYKRALSISKFVVEDNNKWKYAHDEIKDDAGLETLYTSVLGDIAKSEGLTVDLLLEKYDIQVEEHYAERDHIDYVSINEDTYYLYDSMNRLSDGECDKVQIWAYGKEVRTEVGDNGVPYEVEDKSLMITAEAIDPPMGLADFVKSSKKAPIKVNTVPKEEPKKLSIMDLKALADKKKEAEAEDAEKLLQEFESAEDFQGEVNSTDSGDESNKDSGIDSEDSEESTVYTFEEVKVLVDKAYQDGYQSGYQKAIEEKG